MENVETIMNYKLSVPLRVQNTMSEYYDQTQTLDVITTEEFFESFLINLSGWNSTIELLNIPKISREEAIHNVFQALRSSYSLLGVQNEEMMINDDDNDVDDNDNISTFYPIIFEFYEKIINNNNIEQIIPTTYSYNNIKHTFDYNEYRDKKGELLSNISLIFKSTISFDTQLNVLLPLTNIEYITTTIYMLLLILNSKITDKNANQIVNIMDLRSITINILGCTLFNIFTDKCSKVLWIEEETRPPLTKIILSNIYQKFPQLKQIYNMNDLYKIQNENSKLQDYLNDEKFEAFKLYPSILTFNFNDRNRILFNIQQIILNINDTINRENANVMDPSKRKKLLSDDFHIKLYEKMDKYLETNKLEDNTILFNEKLFTELKNIEGFTNIIQQYTSFL